MNHIDKVVWIRACWQVVSELAGDNGRRKKACKRRAPGGTKCLAAALAVLLACMLGGGVAGVAYAAAGETTASGVLNYGTNGTYAQNIFAAWQDGSITQAGSSFDSVVIDSGSTTIKFSYSGSTYSYGSATLNNLLNAINTTSGKAYNTVVAVIQLPGETTPRVYTVKDSTIYLNKIQLLNTLNQVYYQTPDAAKDILQADGDTAKIIPVIQFYAVNGSDLTDLATALANGTGLTPTADSKMVFASYSQLFGANISLPSSPADSSYSYSYASQTVAADGVWRPLDRVATAADSLLDGEYSLTQTWIINSDGTLSPDTGTVTVTNSSSDTTVVTAPTIITVGTLSVGRGGTVDLAYLNTAGTDPVVNHIITTTNEGGICYSGTYATGSYYTTPSGLQEYYRYANRTLLVNNATLEDGTVFRLGSYATTSSLGADRTTRADTIGEATDAVYINNATTADGNKANLYIQLGWVPGVGTSTQGEAIMPENSTGIRTTIMLGILDGADNFTVTGQGSLADGIFSQYEITPVIGKAENYFTDSSGNPIVGSTAWYLDSYSYRDLVTASESGRSAADNLAVSKNLWRSNYLNMFRRMGSLHRQGFTEQRVEMLGGGDGAAPSRGQTAETGGQDNSGNVSRVLGMASYPVNVEDQKENVWVEAWHGRYSSSAGYGRQVDQSYNGMQVGYDKLLNHKIGNGRVYTGFYLSKMEGTSQTASGGGDQDSGSLGIYGTWVGDKGHYLDLALLATRLSNKYHLTGNTGSGTIGQVNGTYSNWAYGLGFQYGYRMPRENGWYWEPSAALFIGRTDGVSYSLSNNLGISQDSYNTVTGRLGLSVGKDLADGNGNIYAGVAALHEFAGGSAIGSFYGNQHMPLDTAGGKDTWWEFSLGGNVRISPTGAFKLDLGKTAGSSIGNDWWLNGGFNWTWGGFWSDGKVVAPKDNAGKNSDLPHSNAAVIVGQVPEAQNKQEAQPSAKAPDDQTRPAGERAANADSAASPQPPAVPEPGPQSTVNSDVYTFAPVTVEAARPDWEKQLSPGQVSVIYPNRFEGEQKDLPDLLERVPGLFVQQVSGDGHYTVARMRGSTAAQVNVYVDGVLMNLNGDAAVNLSTIPVDNVERIEVYRGYVPARFAGAPLGGVINIVTKKPGEVGGTISQGFKSYGGYTGTYELTAPLGNGSLLATFQRDIWDGDFPFRVVEGGTDYGELRRRSNGYRNDNGMVKWQDDHWLVKAGWKQLHEQLPRSVSSLHLGTGLSWYSGYIDYYNKGYYDAEQDIDQKEFQIGRRETAGNLDWGWRISYLDSDKRYRDTGWYRAQADGITLWSKPGSQWADYHSQKWGGNINAALKMGDSHLLELNADLSRETMKCDGNYWDNYLDVYGWKLLKDYKISEYHLTLQDTITLNEANDFKLTPVARADRVEMETLGAADRHWKYSGGAALQKQINEHWSVKTTWGTYNRHPNFYELFGDGAYIRPNEGAAAHFAVSGQGTWESGTQFDFSLNWQGKLLKADTDTVLTWFQRRSKNQLALWVPAVPNAPSSYFPMDTAKVHGFELTHNMQWDRLTLSLAGTWQDSEYTGSQMISGSKSVISYTPEWVWNARLDYRFPGDRLNVFTEYHYTDKQFLGYNDDKKYDAYLSPLATVNLGLKYAFDKRWKLSAGIDDLFNKGYEHRRAVYVTTADYPLAGRMYYATMEYKF